MSESKDVARQLVVNTVTLLFKSGFRSVCGKRVERGQVLTTFGPMSG